MPTLEPDTLPDKSQEFEVDVAANQQQAELKNAVHSRYFALVSEGSSPTSAAVNAIREIGSQARPLPVESPPLAEAEMTAPRSLRFDDVEITPLHADQATGSVSMQRSSSAPGLSAGTQAPTPVVAGREAGGLHRNRDVWKTFGIHLPAGRCLKRLYGGGFDGPVPGSLKSLGTSMTPSRHKRSPADMAAGTDTYMAVNNMGLGTAGLQYRKSMNLFDLCKGDKEFVRWGDAVEGHRVDACWLQVGDRYLPTTVNKIQLLKRWQGKEVLRAEGLRRQESLPPLRAPPKDRSYPKLMVGGVPYGF